MEDVEAAQAATEEIVIECGTAIKSVIANMAKIKEETKTQSRFCWRRWKKRTRES